MQQSLYLSYLTLLEKIIVSRHTIERNFYTMFMDTNISVNHRSILVKSNADLLVSVRSKAIIDIAHSYMPIYKKSELCRNIHKYAFEMPDKYSKSHIYFNFDETYFYLVS